MRVESRNSDAAVDPSPLGCYSCVVRPTLQVVAILLFSERLFQTTKASRHGVTSQKKYIFTFSVVPYLNFQPGQEASPQLREETAQWNVIMPGILDKNCIVYTTRMWMYVYNSCARETSPAWHKSSLVTTNKPEATEHLVQSLFAHFALHKRISFGKVAICTFRTAQKGLRRYVIPTP